MCGEEVQFWFESVNSGIGPTNTYKVFRCKNCSTTQISPIPENLEPFYSNYHFIPKRQAWIRAVKSNKNRLRVLNSVLPKKGLILDVGAGIGSFSAALEQSGFQTISVERDESCRRNIATKTKGLVYSDLSAFNPLEAGTPDALTLWHVFEHLSNPGDFFTELVDKLPNLSKIVIEVPNPMSWQFSLMKKNWPHLDVPRHIFLPSEVGIRVFALKFGFDVATISNRDRKSWSAFSISNFRAKPHESDFIRKCRRLIQLIITPIFVVEPKTKAATHIFLLTKR